MSLLKNILIQDGDNEVCIVCGKKIDISKDTHIDYRHFYIPGAGQLCLHCYYDLYAEKPDNGQCALDMNNFEKGAI